MTDPLLADPFNRWLAERRYRRTSADASRVKSKAQEASDAAEEAAPAGPFISERESRALALGARVLAGVADGLLRSGLPELAEESARSADTLDRLQRRAMVERLPEQAAEPQAER